MKILRRIMFFLLVVVLFSFIAIFLFFQFAPQIGGTPEGERLAKMQAADNYQNGVFVNTVETKMEFKWKDMRKAISHYLFADKTDKNPKIEIKTQPFAKNDFLATPEDSVKFVWFGHSTLLLRIKGMNILIDPVITGQRASMFAFMGPLRFNYSHHITVEELPTIDLMLLSHDHYDHLDYPTIVKLREKTNQFYVPLGTGAHFEKWGVAKEKIKEFNWWQESSFHDITLAFTPTRHFSGRALRDRFSTLWGSWCILTEAHSIYFSGDSGYFPGFKEIGDRYGPFDITFMECGAYNEGWSEIHMFPEQTAQAHLDLQGRYLMPIHWGKFDLSLHPWKESVTRLEKKAEEEGISLFTPEVGQLISISKQKELGGWWKAYQ